MSLKKLVIFGTSEIARLAFHYFKLSGDYQIAAFAVDAQYRNSDSLYGVPILPSEQLRETFPPDNTELFVGASYSNLNKNRAALYDRLKSWNYRLASCVSAKAAVLTQDIGENVLIMDNASVAPSVSIGNNVVVGPNVAICHDSTIKNHVYIAPAACFCGYNLVEDFCVIGAAATIAPRVQIGKSNFIGIGAHIFNNTGDNEAYLTGTTKKSKMPASSAWMIGLVK